MPATSVKEQRFGVCTTDSSSTVNVGELITMVRRYGRFKNTAGNPDAVVLDFINNAYTKLVNKAAAMYPTLKERGKSVTLTGVYTPLPAVVRAQRITRVEDITGRTASANPTYLDANNELVPFANAASTEAAVSRGINLPEIPAYLVNEPHGMIGWSRESGYLVLHNMDWSNKTVIVWYYAVPQRYEEGDDEDVPDLIPEQHHIAIGWEAVAQAQGRDGGNVDQWVLMNTNDSFEDYMMTVSSEASGLRAV